MVNVLMLSFCVENHAIFHPVGGATAELAEARRVEAKPAEPGRAC